MMSVTIANWPGADMYMYILHDIEPLDTGHIFKMCFGGVPLRTHFDKCVSDGLISLALDTFVFSSWRTG